LFIGILGDIYIGDIATTAYELGGDPSTIRIFREEMQTRSSDIQIGKDESEIGTTSWLCLTFQEDVRFLLAHG
jgi:hypothetical protein